MPIKLMELIYTALVVKKNNYSINRKLKGTLYIQNKSYININLLLLHYLKQSS